MGYTQRINRTNMQFRKAMLRLLDQKPLHQITVNAISEEAGFDRSTFYNHYEDQQDLLTQIEDQVLDSINALRTAKHFFKVSDDEIEGLVRLCEEYHDILSRLLSDNGEGHFERRISQAANRAFTAQYGESYVANPEVRLIREGATASSLQILKYWLTTDNTLTVAQVSHTLIAVQQVGPIEALRLLHEDYGREK
ncbi:hypothetical protein [Lactobacillus paracollinoides] [Lactiplantibacillus mudanjiangensis]|uniref:TetR/AcrR family transcriptional regulator n=1 Tax=Lactiplantibacillus mudanjiangensis TaxID=1296538 RepID=UPI0010151D2C|nr:hypothetical protein [Lactobacillus paracollinoides] [Lactiplantibacillus mudanjiangensis]